MTPPLAPSGFEGVGGSTRIGASRMLVTARETARRIVGHPANRGRRGRALALYLVWQLWQRVVARPWTIRLGETLRIRLHPHSYVAAFVLYYRVPDYEEMSFVRAYLREGDLFVDVGANIGVYSLWASETEGVDVLAFEPSTVTHGRAMENVALNDLRERVQVLRKAVGAKRAVVCLTNELAAMNRVIDGDLDGSGNGVELVEQTTLDDELGQRPPALIKIDVEGRELDVLRGGRAVITRDRPALIVEVNDPHGLAEMFGELGYRSWWYDPDTGALAPVTPVLYSNVIALPAVNDAPNRLQARRL